VARTAGFALAAPPRGIARRCALAAMNPQF